MKYVTTLLILWVLTVSATFSQPNYPKVIKDGSDTLLCFKADQARQMAKKLTKGKECAELNEALEKDIETLRGISLVKNELIGNYELEIVKYKSIDEKREKQITALQFKNELQKKEIKRHKRQKVVIGGVAAVLVVLVLL